MLKFIILLFLLFLYINKYEGIDNINGSGENDHK